MNNACHTETGSYPKCVVLVCVSKAKNNCRVSCWETLHFLFVGFNPIHFGGATTFLCALERPATSPRNPEPELSFCAENLLKVL